LDRDENQDLDFSKEAERAQEEIVNLSTIEKKPVLQETNSNLPVYKEDD